MPGMGPFLGLSGGSAEGEGAPAAPQASQAPSWLPPELLALIASMSAMPTQVSANVQAQQMAEALRNRGLEGASPQSMQHGYAALPGAIGSAMQGIAGQMQIKKQQQQMADLIRQYQRAVGGALGAPDVSGGIGASPM